MKFIFGFFFLFTITIGTTSASKIEIFEIRENENGLELKNLNSNPRSSQRADPLLKLLRGPKADSQAVKFAKQLLSKLKSSKADEKVNRFNDDANIYILNSDVLDDDYDSSSEDAFDDKTRNDRNSIDSKDIKEILMQLLQSERKPQPQKKKIMQPMKRAVLRSQNADFEICFLVATNGTKGSPKIEIYEINENDNGLEFKNLNSKTRSSQTADAILKLVSALKPENRVVTFIKKLLGKLISVRGEKRTNPPNNGAHIYIINRDVFDDSSEEDATRNRNNVNQKDIQEVLLELLQSDRKTQPLKRKRIRMKRLPDLRTSNVIEAQDGTSAPMIRHVYEEDTNVNANNKFDDDDSNQS